MRVRPRVFVLLAHGVAMFLCASCATKIQTAKLPRNLVGFPLGDEPGYRHSDTRVEIPNACTKIVVMEGNGRVGYQSVIFDEQNNIEVCLFKGDEDDGTKVQVYTTRLPGRWGVTIERLTESANLSSLWTSYSTQYEDGAGALLVVFGKNGQVGRSRMHNHFPKEFQQLWKEVVLLVESVPEEAWLHRGTTDRFEIYKKYMGE